MFGLFVACSHYQILYQIHRRVCDHDFDFFLQLQTVPVLYVVLPTRCRRVIRAQSAHGRSKLKLSPQPTTPLYKSMSALNSQSSFERLPAELLEQILLFTSARDIFRLSLVRNIAKITRIRAFSEHRNVLKGQSRFLRLHTGIPLDPIPDRSLWCRIAT